MIHTLLAPSVPVWQMLNWHVRCGVPLEWLDPRDEESRVLGVNIAASPQVIAEIRVYWPHGAWLGTGHHTSRPEQTSVRHFSPHMFL